MHFQEGQQMNFGCNLKSMTLVSAPTSLADWKLPLLNIFVVFPSQEKADRARDVLRTVPQLLEDSITTFQWLLHQGCTKSDSTLCTVEIK